LLAGCKFLSAPSWEEAEANDKGVAGDRKSERSHQQTRGNGKEVEATVKSIRAEMNKLVIVLDNPP